MKPLNKIFLCGVSALSLAVGSAFANDFPGDSSWDSRAEFSAPSPSELALETRSDGSMTPIEQPQVHEQDSVSYVMLEPVDVAYVEVYDIDSDRDGKADGQLLLEQSDTFVMMTPLEPSSGQDLETSSGG
jgi:hypothetical protein